MKNIIPALALAAFLFVPFSGAVADDSADCTQGKSVLEGFLNQVPNVCKADADCDGFYYRVDSCAAPVMLPAAHASKEFIAALEVRQNLVRKLCYPEGNAASDKPPCSPVPFKAACEAGKCVNKAAQ